MIGVDTNILLHAFNVTSPENSIAKKTVFTVSYAYSKKYGPSR